MTAIVTAEQLVSGLATRINAGSDASVSGANKQLKDAMVSKSFFSGGTGGGGGVMDTATATMNFNYSVPGTSSSEWGTPATVTSSAQWESMSPNAANLKPNDTLYGYYTWDTVSNSSSSLGAWSNNRRYTFARNTVATVTAMVGMYAAAAVPNSYRNMHVTVNIGNVNTNPVGRVHFIRVIPTTHNINVPVVAGEMSWTKAYVPGDFIEVRYVMHTLNGITDIENRAGVGRMCHYGSFLGNESRMDIVALN